MLFSRESLRWGKNPQERFQEKSEWKGPGWPSFLDTKTVVKIPGIGLAQWVLKRWAVHSLLMPLSLYLRTLEKAVSPCLFYYSNSELHFCSSFFPCLAATRNSPSPPLSSPALAPLKGTFYSDVYLEMLVLQNLAWLYRSQSEGEGPRPPAWRRFEEAQTRVAPVKGSQLR